MKFFNFCIVWIAFLLGSCQQGILEKPKSFLSEEKMEKILYEITLLNAAKSTNHSFFENNYVDVNSIIYKKNGIDSLQFAENMVYYSSNPEKYKKMLHRIERKIHQEDSLRILRKKESDSLQMLQREKELSEQPIDTTKILGCGVEIR